MKKTAFISLESDRVISTLHGFLVDAAARFLSDNVDASPAELRDVARVVTLCAELIDNGAQEET